MNDAQSGSALSINPSLSLSSPSAQRTAVFSAEGPEPAEGLPCPLPGGGVVDPPPDEEEPELDDDDPLPAGGGDACAGTVPAAP